MKKKLFGYVAAVTLSAALIAGCNGAANVSGNKSKPKLIRLGDVVAEDNPETAAEKFFAKRVSELTNGQYQVQVFSNSVLGSHSSMNKQVRDGSLEMTVTSSADLTEFDNKLSIFSLPYLVDSKEKLFKLEEGKLGEVYAKTAEKYGFKILGFFDSGSRNIYSKGGPVSSPDDVAKRHLRLRVISNPVMIDTINAMGAQAVPLNPSEIYNAIQQGVVDGAENSVTFYLTQKHNEIAPYFNETNHFFSVDPFMVSLKWFNSLPADIQKSIEQAASETIKYEREQWAKAEQENIKKAEELGVKINRNVDVAAFKKALQPVLDKYGPEFGEMYQILKQNQ